MKKPGKTWWGRRYLQIIEGFLPAGILVHGGQYLTGNRIEPWRVDGPIVRATVRERANPYYGSHEASSCEARLEFMRIPDTVWLNAIALIGNRAGLVSRLLFNEMPDEIETFLTGLGVSLLPRESGEIRSACSCGQAPSCRHVAALHCLLATRLDHDPFLLFELRGLSRGELITRLKATSLGTALASALDESRIEPNPATSFFTRPPAVPLPGTTIPRDFWRGKRKLPSGVEFTPPAAISGILVRKGGDYPPFWDKDESFVEVMDAIYNQVRKKGKDWL